MRGPGLFLIVPIIDTIAYWIDTRVITTALTYFEQGHCLGERRRGSVLEGLGPMKAALDVADYRNAIRWAAQTALRDVMGRTVLSDMLEGREKISAKLQRVINLRTLGHQCCCCAVEVEDVSIPRALQDAMSMQVQARASAPGPRHPWRFAATGCGKPCSEQ
jgi:hypothetical protein